MSTGSRKLQLPELTELEFQLTMRALRAGVRELALRVPMTGVETAALDRAVRKLTLAQIAHDRSRADGPPTP